MTKDTDSKTTSAWPMAFDFTKLMQPYKLPGVDFSDLLAREKKNIEALTKANRIAFEGWQALIRKQSEILKETMAETVAAAKKQDGTKIRADLAKQGFEKALANMRSLAEMAAQSQKEAFDVLSKRAGENFEELKSLGKKK